MASLADFFERLLRDKRKYLGAAKGSEFEERIYTEMGRQVGLSRIQKDQLAKGDFGDIKSRMQLKSSTGDRKNTTDFRQHFLFQPYGSQDYPDILVFNGDHIHAVEIKFSKGNHGKPMWNSGSPRPSGIYIFGSYGRGDITFFLGKSVLEPEIASMMHAQWERIGKEISDFNTDVASEQKYGFHLYPRKAFDQNKTLNPNAVINFFTNPNRQALEDEVIAHLRRFEEG